MPTSILDYIIELGFRAFQRILDQVADRIELVSIAEDLGTQESLLMSPNWHSKVRTAGSQSPRARGIS